LYHIYTNINKNEQLPKSHQIMNTKEIKTYANGNLDLAFDRHRTVTGLITTDMFHLS